jgi:hypothetical protein
VVMVELLPLMLASNSARRIGTLLTNGYRVM